MECALCGGLLYNELHVLPFGRIMECAACKLVSLRDDQERLQVFSNYDETYYRRGDAPAGYSDYFGDERAIREKTSTAIVASLLALAPRDPLIDVGCGGGYLVQAGVSAGRDCVGVDGSLPAVRAGQETLGLTGLLHHAEIGQWAASHPHGYFTVTLMDVIEHVGHPPEFLRSCVDLLAQSGVVVIATPRFGGWMYRASQRDYVQFKPDHLYYFNESTLVRLLECVGGEWELMSMSAFLEKGGDVNPAVRRKYARERDHMVALLRPT